MRDSIPWAVKQALLQIGEESSQWIQGVWSRLHRCNAGAKADLNKEQQSKTADTTVLSESVTRTLTTCGSSVICTSGGTTWLVLRISTILVHFAECNTHNFIHSHTLCQVRVHFIKLSKFLSKMWSYNVQEMQHKFDLAAISQQRPSDFVNFRVMDSNK